MGSDPFHGRDFDKEEFDHEDRASLRHMKSELSKIWPQLSGAAQLAKGAKVLSGILAVAGIIGGALAFAIANGWLS